MGVAMASKCTRYYASKCRKVWFSVGSNKPLEKFAGDCCVGCSHEGQLWELTCSESNNRQHDRSCLHNLCACIASNLADASDVDSPMQRASCSRKSSQYQILKVWLNFCPACSRCPFKASQKVFPQACPQEAKACAWSLQQGSLSARHWR